MPIVTGSIPAATAQFSCTSTCVVDDAIYMFGGFGSGPSLNFQDVYKLDLKPMKWSLVSTTVIEAFSCFVPVSLFYQYFRVNHRYIVLDIRLRQSRTAYSFMEDLELLKYFKTQLIHSPYFYLKGTHGQLITPTLDYI